MKKLEEEANDIITRSQGEFKIDQKNIALMIADLSKQTAHVSALMQDTARASRELAAAKKIDRKHSFNPSRRTSYNPHNVCPTPSRILGSSASVEVREI